MGAKNEQKEVASFFLLYLDFTWKAAVTIGFNMTLISLTPLLKSLSANFFCHHFISADLSEGNYSLICVTWKFVEAF